MKPSKAILALGACALLLSPAAAQEVVKPANPPASVAPGPVATDETGKAISVDGTVALFGENAIMLRSGTSNDALPYQFSNNTAWVDEGGNPVTREDIRPGLPISLYFARDVDGLVVAKAVLHPLPTPLPGATKTATIETTFQFTGTIAEKSDDSMTLRTDNAASPVRFRYSSTTQWMDGSGHSLTPDAVGTGVRAMVYYSKGATGLVISKIVVGHQPERAVEKVSLPKVSREAVSDSKAAPEEK